jgi:multicomponent Na+:H+ antiporter subunit G
MNTLTIGLNIISYISIAIGLLFWFWGTSALLTKRSILFKLHSLSVSDTLGSIAIVFGLLLQRPKDFPLLILAIISLALWNTMLGYVLAYCASSNDPQWNLKIDKREQKGGEQ